MKSKPGKLIFVLLAVIILVALALVTKFLFLDKQTKSVSALQIDSVPPSEIYLDDKLLGKTPYQNEKMLPGEYKLKLTATGVTGTYFPWETKIKLNPDSLTYINRDIGSTDDNSGHQILWLEKLPSSDLSQLAIISDPDGANVSVDGADKGQTSLILKDLEEGDHRITVSKTGFSDQVINGKIVKGFRFNAVVKLARGSVVVAQTPVASPSATPAVAVAKDDMAKPYVIIKSTPVGYLRVRFSPTVNATETGKVKPLEKFPLVDEVVGWSKISVATISGWVNDQYLQKVK